MSQYLQVAPNSPVLPTRLFRVFSPERCRAMAGVWIAARLARTPAQASALPRPPPAAPRRPGPPSSLRPRPRRVARGAGDRVRAAPPRPAGARAAPEHRTPDRAPSAHSPRRGPPAATLARSLAGSPSRRRKCGPHRQSAPSGRSRNQVGATLYGAGPTGKKEPDASPRSFPSPAPLKTSGGPQDSKTCGGVPLWAPSGLRGQQTAARSSGLLKGSAE